MAQDAGKNGCMLKHRLDALEQYIQARVPTNEQRITNLERLAIERMRRAEELRYLERIERLEQHIDRQADLIDGLLEVLIATHPDSVQLFDLIRRDAGARLRLVKG